MEECMSLRPIAFLLGLAASSMMGARALAQSGSVTIHKIDHVDFGITQGQSRLVIVSKDQPFCVVTGDPSQVSALHRRLLTYIKDLSSVSCVGKQENLLFSSKPKTRDIAVDLANGTDNDNIELTFQTTNLGAERGSLSISSSKARKHDTLMMISLRAGLRSAWNLELTAGGWSSDGKPRSSAIGCNVPGDPKLVLELFDKVRQATAHPGGKVTCSVGDRVAGASAGGLTLTLDLKSSPDIFTVGVKPSS
jgi:hypothetical protein